MDLTIDRVRVTPVSVPLDRAVSGSGYTKATRDTLVVEIDTDAGVTGRVYAGDERDHQRSVAAMIVDDLAPAIVGEDAASVEARWAQLFERATTATDHATAMHAVGAVDTAIWDTIGRALDTPLYQVWGAYRDRLPMIAIGGYYEDGRELADLAAEAREYESMGLAGMKLKVGGAPIERDIDRLHRVREATGEEFVIACDSNRAWSVADAIAFAEAARDYEIEWLEEPVVWYDEYRGMRLVRERTGVPVTAGQSEITPHGCRQLLEADAVDGLNFDASLGGGPTAWRKVAGLAELNGVTIGHHEEPHIAMHLLAATAQGTYVECFHPDIDPVWYEMVVDTPAPENGSIALPDAPGIGLRLDQGFIDTHGSEPRSHP